MNFTDLKIGQTIPVYGKDLLLYDCDEFTREFYVQKLGMAPEDLQKIDVFPKKEVVYVQPKEVKHAFSIGNDEEALQAQKSLVLKPPKKDMKQFVLNDGKLLRYVAKLVNIPGFPLKSRYDAEREFVITYYLVDDTILIFEPPQRNSGIVGGKFLERQKVKSPENKVYTKQDLTVGSHIIVYCRAFMIMSADEYTLSYMEDQGFPESNFEVVSAKLKDSISGDKIDDLKSLLISTDAEGEGYTSAKTLVDVVGKVGGSLSPQEAITICRKLNNSTDTVDTAASLDLV